MSHIRQLSIPADNPEYFNSSRWLEPAVQSSVTAPQAVTNPIMETPVQVLESIKNIDEMVAKEETKTRSKKRLGPLKKLFRSASRRGSASEVEVGFSNINSSPLPPVPHTNHYASLPSSPRKIFSEKTQARVNRANEGAGDRLNNNIKLPSGNIIPPSLRHRYLHSTLLAKHLNLPSSRSHSSGARQDSSWPGMVLPLAPRLHSSCRGYRVNSRICPILS